jgi:hypothetical protein
MLRARTSQSAVRVHSFRRVAHFLTDVPMRWHSLAREITVPLGLGGPLDLIEVR